MHLLKVISDDADQLNLELFQVFDEQVDYAILSHRWGHARDEVSFFDMQNGLERQRKGFQKVEACCRQALRDGLEYVWIDTCCIDKSSSAELSEAINSMYEYYKRAVICYAYLFDVDGAEEDIYSDGSTFRSSQWFTRGWTLQELIAPVDITFFAKDWSEIGRKSNISRLLHEITNVMEEVLLHRLDVADVCVSQKMYWASNRRTTRLEDRAYSLIGLFNLSLPIIYGEGPRAFRRLQEEIIRIYFDHTIFAWEMNTVCSGLLASSPDAFANSAEVTKMPLVDFVNKYSSHVMSTDYTITNRGIKIQLPVSPALRHEGLYIGALAARLHGRRGSIPIILREDITKPHFHYFRTRTSSSSLESQCRFVSDEKWDINSGIWVAEPREIRIENVRELVPDNVARMNCYTLRIWAGMNGHNLLDSHILGSSPIPQTIERDTGIYVLQLEPRDVWVVAASLKVPLEGGLEADLEAMILFVVINNELMVHLEVNSVQESPYKNLDVAEGCKYFYERCLSSSESPCTDHILRYLGRTTVKIKGSTIKRDLRLMILYHTHWSVASYGQPLQVLLVASTEEDINNKMSSGQFSMAGRGPNSNKPLKELLSGCKPLM